MPERPHAPGETDEHATTSHEPADGSETGSRTNGPSPRPVMPSPKSRQSGPTNGSPPSPTAETMAVGAVTPRSESRPDPADPAEEPGAADPTVRSEAAATEEPPTVAGNPAAAAAGTSGDGRPTDQPESAAGASTTGAPKPSPSPAPSSGQRPSPSPAAQSGQSGSSLFDSGPSASGQGQPGRPGSGQQTSGQPEPGRSAPGQVAAGQSGPAETASGRPSPGQSGQGQPTSGQSGQGQPVSGQGGQGQPESSQPEPGRSASGQPTPGPSAPEQSVAAGVSAAQSAPRPSPNGSGQSGSSLFDSSRPGQPVIVGRRQSSAGQSSAGQPVSGQSGSGQSGSAQSGSTQPSSDQPASGQPGSGQSSSSGPAAGQAASGAAAAASAASARPDTAPSPQSRPSPAPAAQSSTPPSPQAPTQQTPSQPQPAQGASRPDQVAPRSAQADAAPTSSDPQAPRSGTAAAASGATAASPTRPAPSPGARPDTGERPTAPQASAAAAAGTAGTAAETARVQAVAPSQARPSQDPSAGATDAPSARPGAAEQDRTVATPARPPSSAAAAPTAPIAPRPSSTEASGGTGADENTQVLPRIHGADVATAQFPDPQAGAAGNGPTAEGPSGSGPTGGSGDGEDGGRPRRRGLLIVGALVALLVLAYLGDLLFSSGSVPRGVVVAGQQIGGLSRATAIEKLQGAIEPRSSQPVQVTAGEVRSEVDPKVAGLVVDYQGTLDRAGAQPLNPITRVTSFFGTRDVPVVNSADERSVRTAMEQLAPVVDRAPKDGNVRFDGVNPLPVAPEPGQHLDVESAIGTLEQQWATGAPVALPLLIEQPATTPQDVQQAIDQVARPAVSGPLTVTGEGATGTVKPEEIAEALTFKADPAAATKLVPQINVASLTDVVKPQLASTEKPAVDATLDLAVTPARVVPSVDGRGIDYKSTFGNLVPVLTGTGPRTVPAIYAPKPAEITTQAIQSLGAASEISSFTTGGFAKDSGVNIRRAAEAIDGKIVAPGETFSLNGATDPRDASTGYVDAGIIEDGHPSRGVGGGVSQLATTLYNASYFAGMVDVEHKEHSFYISRYPVAREATVFENLIDVKFRNDGPTPVLIRTVWTPSNVTVKFLGQKQWDVTSQTGPKSNPTPPQLVNIPPGQPCSPSKGSPGFTATDTRTMRNVQTGETTSKTRTVRYNPQPIVKCG